MRRLWIAILLTLLWCGHAFGQTWFIRDLSDVPPAFRTPNWPAGPGPKAGQGSCVNASTITVLNWMGLHEHAAWWPYEGGEWQGSHIRNMESSGLLYAYTENSDMSFIDWAGRNRMVMGVFYFPYHAVNIVGVTADTITLMDNNRIHTFIRVPRREFEQKWPGYGGFAWTIWSKDSVPPPPWPKLP